MDTLESENTYKKLLNKYTHGMCDVLALALHRRHRLLLGLAGVVNRNDPEYPFEVPVHAFAFLNRHAGWIVDAQGVRLVEEMLIDLDGNPFEPSEGRKVWQRLASEVEVREAFTTETITEAQILQAMADLKTLGISDLLAAHKAAVSPARALAEALEMNY